MTGPRYGVVSAPSVGALAAFDDPDASPATARPSWLGPPPLLDVAAVVRLAESVGLRGRGGAGFPAARKIRAVADHRRRPVIVVNASEGEPASGKDAALLRLAPHLVLDGAEILALALGTRDVRVWAPGHDPGAAAVLSSAVAARGASAAGRRRSTVEVQVVVAPDRFVAGESTAAARGLSGRTPIPRADGRRTSDTGVDNRPTLLLNVETVVQLARLAQGLAPTRLVTVSGAVARPGVVEVADECRLSSVVEAAGGLAEPVRALVLGGYHGTWARASDVDRLWLGDPDGPLADCSIVAALPDDACLLAELDQVAVFLAEQSARQCGPCSFGLPELAHTVRRVLQGTAVPGSVDAHRGLLVGRGACYHPDGSVGFVTSGLAALADEVAEHAAGHGACGRPRRRVLPVSSGGARTAVAPASGASATGSRTVFAGRSA